MALWKYDGTSWNQITEQANPANMVVSGSTLYGNFAGYGIWKYNGTSWSQINSGNPASMVVSDSTLYASFAGYGLWKYDGASWSQVKFQQSGKYGCLRFNPIYELCGIRSPEI